MSVSLVAVFIPLLMMGGIVGRLFREFAVTLSIAIGVSLLVSLTTTPTMCAKFLRPPNEEKHNIFFRASEWSFEGLLKTYTRMLKWVLAYQPVTLTMTILVACLSVFLYIKVPKGFFPQQDTGRLQGSVMAAQDISFQSMSDKMQRYVNIVMKDPSVDSIVGFAGGNTALNQGRFFVMLKSLEQRGPCNKAHFWQSCHYPSRRRRDQPAPGEAGGRAGRDVDHAVVAGSDHRRTLWQCAIPVHTAERESRRP